jgi:AcrR family transcriptional regulator
MGKVEIWMVIMISNDQILDAALEVIIQRGYAGATTREIAAVAGINEVTLFRRFGSKAKLLEAIVEQEAEKFSTAGIEYTGNLDVDLQQVVQFYQALMQSRGRVITTMLTEIPRQPELMDMMQTPLKIVMKVTALIERYQNQGALVKEPPVQAFIALVGPLLLGGVLGFAQPQLAPLTSDPAALVQRYLQGHAATSGALR